MNVYTLAPFTYSFVVSWESFGGAALICCSGLAAVVKDRPHQESDPGPANVEGTCLHSVLCRHLPLVFAICC